MSAEHPCPNRFAASPSTASRIDCCERLESRRKIHDRNRALALRSCPLYGHCAALKQRLRSRVDRDRANHAPRRGDRMRKLPVSRPWNTVFSFRERISALRAKANPAHRASDKSPRRIADEAERITPRRSAGRDHQDRGAAASIARRPARAGLPAAESSGAIKWPRIRLPRICRLRVAPVSGISA